MIKCLTKLNIIEGKKNYQILNEIKQNSKLYTWAKYT